MAAVFLSSDRLATTGWDGSVKIWDVPTGQELISLPPRLTTDGRPVAVLALAASTGKLAAGGVDGTVLVWDGTVEARP
jgi:WD40 repeat protein